MEIVTLIFCVGTILFFCFRNHRARSILSENPNGEHFVEINEDELTKGNLLNVYYHLERDCYVRITSKKLLSLLEKEPSIIGSLLIHPNDMSSVFKE